VKLSVKKQCENFFLLKIVNICFLGFCEKVFIVELKIVNNCLLILKNMRYFIPIFEFYQ